MTTTKKKTKEFKQRKNESVEQFTERYFKKHNIKPHKDFENHYHLEFIDDIYMPQPVFPTFTDSDKEKIEEFLGNHDSFHDAVLAKVKLSVNERRVLACYLNEAGETLTLEQMAKITGKSIEGVRQILMRIPVKIKKAISNMEDNNESNT